jgi:CRISPR/Cas system-associated exonuclease Cas4 (RecB family)
MSDFLPRAAGDLDLTFPPQLRHISASSINMALRCEEQFRQVYILGKRQPPNLAMLAGRADHKAIEVSMAQKIDSGVDLPLGDVREAFVAALEGAVSDSGGISEVQLGNDDYDAVRRSGQDVVAGYQKIVSPTIQPTHVEQEFRHQLEGVPVEILGYVDLIAENRVDLLTADGGFHTNMRIIDRKRAKRASKEASVDWKLQAGIYQLEYPFDHDWHVSVVKKVPEFLTDWRQTPSDRAITERRVRAAVEKIGWLYQRYGPDEEWPVTGKSHAWACGYCGFRDTCWGWAT